MFDMFTPLYGGLNIRILENGVCGTDREIVNGVMHVASVPSGDSYMVLGHEAIGILDMFTPLYGGFTVMALI